MRIIGGIAKRTKLYTLSGENTRPTLDRVRESLFNILQGEIQDSVFLDLFAGSGAVGIEAVSRGAEKAILCDKSKQAMQVIQKNIEKTHMQDKIEIYQSSFEKAINDISKKVDIVFLDPPYQTDFAYEAIKMMIKKELLKEKSLIIIETDQEKRILEKIEKLKVHVIDRRKYGRANLIFLKAGKRKG